MWDATCVDTFCQLHCRRAAIESGGAAAYAEEEKYKKYAHLDSIYRFQPIAIETSGSIGPRSRAFLRDLGEEGDWGTQIVCLFDAEDLCRRPGR